MYGSKHMAKSGATTKTNTTNRCAKARVIIVHFVYASCVYYVKVLVVRHLPCTAHKQPPLSPLSLFYNSAPCAFHAFSRCSDKQGEIGEFPTTSHANTRDIAVNRKRSSQMKNAVFLSVFSAVLVLAIYFSGFFCLLVPHCCGFGDSYPCTRRPHLHSHTTISQSSFSNQHT